MDSVLLAWFLFCFRCVCKCTGPSWLWLFLFFCSLPFLCWFSSVGFGLAWFGLDIVYVPSIWTFVRVGVTLSLIFLLRSFYSFREPFNGEWSLKPGWCWCCCCWAHCNIIMFWAMSLRHSLHVQNHFYWHVYYLCTLQIVRTVEVYYERKRC